MKIVFSALVAAACVATCMPLAIAQGTQAPVAGPPMNSMHGGGMQDPLGMLAHLKAKLNLNTSQQQQFDAAVAQGKATRATIKANMQQLRSTLQAQVAAGAPDFDSLAAIADTLQPQNLAARKQARAAWLALYDTFSAEQKSVVASALQARWARVAAWRARMRGQATQ
jgi:Spy/CpxP family protein refolding chaperone